MYRVQSQQAVQPPAQLDLFQTIIGHQSRTYSQSLELWDQAPKYVVGPILDTDGSIIERPKTCRTLPTQLRHFVHDGMPMSIQITPAWLLERHGIERHFFPCMREQLLEQTIRRIAISNQRTEECPHVSHGRLYGARFTLGEVCRELAQTGHKCSWEQVRQALLVASGSILTLDLGSGTPPIRAPIFPVISLPSGVDQDAVVKFHPLVTTAITAFDFRQIDYICWMEKLQSIQARWLFRRLTHQYIQAGYTNNFNILATTIICESGLFTRTAKRSVAINSLLWIPLSRNSKTAVFC
jgi:hypothetical protein